MSIQHGTSVERVMNMTTTLVGNSFVYQLRYGTIPLLDFTDIRDLFNIYNGDHGLPLNGTVLPPTAHTPTSPGGLTPIPQDERYWHLVRNDYPVIHCDIHDDMPSEAFHQMYERALSVWGANNFHVELIGGNKWVAWVRKGAPVSMEGEIMCINCGAGYTVDDYGGKSPCCGSNFTTDPNEVRT